MGYFSNGTEGLLYEEQYCSRCIHYEGCPIWLAHLTRNSAGANDDKSVLHMLIPRSKDGLDNEQCLMFTPDPPDRDRIRDEALEEAAKEAVKESERHTVDARMDGMHYGWIGGKIADRIRALRTKEPSRG